MDLNHNAAAQHEAPTVSVLMAVYNDRRFLSEAVESILSQTFEDFELIIINDGSTDGSTDLLTHFAEQDSRIQLIHQSNRGLTCSLNTAIERASGRFLARMDADDIALPERLNLQVQFLHSHPNHGAVGGQVELIDAEGEPVGEGRTYNRLRQLPLCHEYIDEALLHIEWPLVHPAVMMRRTHVVTVGGYDERYKTNQDHDLFLKLAELTRLANLPDTLLKYRRHTEQVTQTTGQQHKFALKHLVRAAHKRRRLTLPENLKYLELQRALRKVPFLERKFRALRNRITSE